MLQLFILVHSFTTNKDNHLFNIFFSFKLSFVGNAWHSYTHSYLKKYGAFYKGNEGGAKTTFPIQLYPHWLKSRAHFFKLKADLSVVLYQRLEREIMFLQY